MEKIYTCQICTRAIKLVTGWRAFSAEEREKHNGALRDRAELIAHHGYQRPGDGWQTASCWGARHLPYEVSCDQIQPCIDSMKDHRANVQTALDDMIKNPPASLMERPTTWSRSSEPKVFQKPEDFDPHKEHDFRWSSFNTYHNEYRHIRSERERTIKALTRDIDRLEKRLAAWVSPAA